MRRLTRKPDKWPCRIGECLAEDWIEDLTGIMRSHWGEEICEHCPFEKYINRLAELEDEAELMEDDRK